MDFTPVQDRHLAARGIRFIIEFFHFGMFFCKSVFNNVFKETYTTVGFAPLQDRLLAGASMRPSVVVEEKPSFSTKRVIEP